MHSVKLQALSRVKVNLYLHIIGKRADGYHNLDSLVAFPEIGDEILVSIHAKSKSQGSKIKLVIQSDIQGSFQGKDFILS